MKIFLSTQELQQRGCKSCIWKANSLCPHNIEGDEVYEFNEKTENSFDETSFQRTTNSDTLKHSGTQIKGYCPEYIQFLLSFAGESDSKESMLEKFNIYIKEMESHSDYTRYKQLEKEYEKARQDYYSFIDSHGYDDPERESKKEHLMELDGMKNAMKAWWSGMSDSVTKNLGRIADRDSRSKDAAKLPGIMNARTINFNIDNSKKKEIEDKA